jgi:hypothetical protein
MDHKLASVQESSLLKLNTVELFPLGQPNNIKVTGKTNPITFFSQTGQKFTRMALLAGNICTSAIRESIFSYKNTEKQIPILERSI